MRISFSLLKVDTLAPQPPPLLALSSSCVSSSSLQFLFGKWDGRCQKRERKRAAPFVIRFPLLSYNRYSFLWRWRHVKTCTACCAGGGTGSTDCTVMFVTPPLKETVWFRFLYGPVFRVDGTRRKSVKRDRSWMCMWRLYKLTGE